MREAWTDRRLDSLSHKIGEFERRVDVRFEHIDERFDQLESRFDRFEARFDAYNRATLQMSAVVIAALIGFIATQV